jgi:membrane protein
MRRIDKIILNSSFFRFFIEKSKRTRLPGFERVPLYDVGRYFVKQVKRVGLNDRAQAISFSLLSAIPAGTLFLCTLVPLLPVSKKISRQLLLITKDITPDKNTYELVSKFLEDFLNKRHAGLLSISFLLTIFYASNAMMSLMRTFNKSLVYNHKRNMLEARWMAVKLTALVVLLVIGSVTILVTQNELLANFFHIHSRSIKWRWLFRTLRWIAIIPMFYYSIAFIYKYGPAVHKRWRLSSPGTLLATLLILLTTILFSSWVNKFGGYNKIYGSIGAILILMFLVYLNSMIILIGYELNVSIYHLKTVNEERNKRRNAAAKARS